MQQQGGLRRKFPVMVIAHRGASGECPENTRAAFQRALELGVDMLECDVQCSRDGTVVVLHDARVDRTTDGRGWVQHLTWHALKQLDAGAWFAPAFRGERIPTLEEVLELAAGKATLNIEIKSGADVTGGSGSLAKKVAALVTQAGLLHSVLVSSFDRAALVRVKECAPDLATALLTMSRPRGGAPAVMRRLGVQAVHVSRHRASRAFIAEARTLQCPVRAFTVDEVPAMRRLIARGIDGLFTNYPARLQRLLMELFPPGSCSSRDERIGAGGFQGSLAPRGGEG